MPTILESEPEVNPFGDLIPKDVIGGEGDSPAYQVVGGRFGEVPKAEINTPTDYGPFDDLIPDNASNQDLGPFADLVPASPTSESEKALAETLPPQPAQTPKADTGIAHQTLNAVRVFGSAAGKYIFQGLQGLELETAKVMTNPPAELTTPQAEAVLLPQEQQDELEKQYVAETQAAVPEALARAEYWKMRAENADKQSEVDPALADTIPARLSAAAGHATAMGMEALIPGAGLPLMVMHGALATEAEAMNAGKTPAEAEDAAVRSAIGLAIFGGASKLAALGVAKLLPKVVSDPSKLTTFVAQFTGQGSANETSSRAIGAWEAAANAPEGQKVKAAINALSEQTLEGAALNVVFAGIGAAKATGKAQQRATSPVSEPVRSPAPETGVRPETARYAESDVPNTAPHLRTKDSAPLETDVSNIRGTAESSLPVAVENRSRPEPTRTEANAASKIGPEVVPEYLRPDPELVRLINEPAATVKPQMKMAAAAEGGALFSRGGARTAVAPKGTTPKGDTNFLRVEPGIKRMFKGLERHGDADVIADTPNKVGKMLSNAMRRHTDLALEIKGQLTAKVDKAIQGPKKKIDAAFDEVNQYEAARENGRPLPILSPKAQELLRGWEDIAESTGNLARANDVQVFDPVLNQYRSGKWMGRSFLPRVFKPEVEKAMRDPKKNTPLWDTLVDEFAKHRGISDVEAARELRAEAGRFASNDYMGNLERARTGQLPEIFYDYDLRRIMPQYIETFSERMAQIIAYGQRLGPREKPQRDNLWDIARKESENGNTQEWLNSSEDRATNTRARTPLSKFTASSQTLASGLYLSSPTTTVQRNVISGFLSTTELMGVRRSLSNVVRSFKTAERGNAREIGAVQRDMGALLHADQLGDSALENAVRGFTRGALKYSGYTFGENFVRTHGFLSAAQFAREGIAALAKNPKSMRAKESLGLFKRMRVNAETIFAEGAKWETGPETRRFIREFIKATQGGYRFDQVPGYAQSTTGRFLYQYGRWGTQRAQNIARNGLRPMFGEEVTWNGKTMSRVDFRPIAKMAASAVLAGETFGLLASVMFGRDRRDASLNEIKEAWKDDEKLAVAMALERVMNDVIMSGMFGIWGQPIDWAKSLKNQSRLKNPMEPPGLGSIEAFKDLGQAAIDQDFDLTKGDLLTFVGKVMPGAKQTVDVARNVFDEPIYEAQNDVKTLRAAAQRWAKGEGMDVSPKSNSDFRKSPMAPTYEPIKEALLVGDAQTAKVLTAEFLNKQTGNARSKARQSLKASIQQSQPFRAGPYTAKVHRDRFQTWARKNLSEADYLQTKRIQERYIKAAQTAGLW